MSGEANGDAITGCVTSIGHVAVEMARGVAKRPEEVATILAEVAVLMAKTAQAIRHAETLVEKVRTCNQTDCDEDAEFVTTFPGREEPDGICGQHANAAKTVYQTLGCPLQFEPILEWLKRNSVRV